MKTARYEGRQVLIGLDVHKEFFVASCICEGVVVKRCRMPGMAEAVIALVEKEFRGAQVLAEASRRSRPLTQVHSFRFLSQARPMY
jgi:hypothetical protein